MKSRSDHIHRVNTTKRSNEENRMIAAIIPAKGDSRRLRNKNLLEIGGKTLVAHAVEYARDSQRIDKIFVSTDAQNIADHAKALGVAVIMREKRLGGETPLIEVYRHAFSEIHDSRITHLVGIQPDNPDRTIDVDKAIEYAVSNNIDNLFTVDSNGRRNGALNILNKNALMAKPFVYASTLRDDCTNIHTPLDYLKASRNLSAYADSILVEGRVIGKGGSTFIIAEAACNHMCDLDLAKQMIDGASEAGADAIKFQTYKAEKLVTANATAFWGEEKCSQLEYYRRLDRFGKEDYQALFAHAREKHIIPFSSPFDAESIEMLADLGMPLFKIASCDIPNLMHLRQIAAYQRPIILSTGASTFEEIDRAIETIFEQGNYQLMLLACTLSYPTKAADANFKRITTLKERYPGMIVGISDHTEPDSHMVIPSAAVALGAKIVEKHYTLDRNMTGSGHFFAVNPDDLKTLVQNIRLTEVVLGDGSFGVAESEKEAWLSARRSIVANRRIHKGDTITEDVLGWKRPGGGLGAEQTDLIIGKRVTRDIETDERITLDLLEKG
jgi:sialic acid synthase SpsE/CMP-N-acetylneuraminic acid synthetase